ncbi:PA14 domain-containing protein [Gilvimarinus sp. DA14]|uniref:PA14 domain-containing protein n=1 Tax=Gilvimarinus sp. DA14 TaxID=2956798 RepID=UPI0020B8750B|nr:PA14 domain-containing protein [Gilvimarinus sp. DA14]UTF61494.1 PA14 domain-containing protein [Gilvimarinus sp. DA14]
MSKNTIFSLLLFICALLIIVRVIPPSVDENLALVLSKSRSNITNINHSRNISDTRTVMIDKVELNQDNRFKHPVLGVLGWTEDFYADIESRFRVTEKGRYRFMVGSDDGFSLKIDNKRLCQYPKDRPFSKQSCYRLLDVGEHTLTLSYFQGFGNSGLTLEAGLANGAKPKFWGEDISGIEYIVE